jgi:hypothetical protein
MKVLSIEQVMALPKRRIEKKLCGVYFLFSRDRLVYVGRSANIERRLFDHGTEPKWRRVKIDSWAWLPCSLRKAHQLERVYIELLRPPLNVDAATWRQNGRRWPPRSPGGAPKRNSALPKITLAM